MNVNILNLRHIPLWKVLPPWLGAGLFLLEMMGLGFCQTTVARGQVVVTLVLRQLPSGTPPAGVYAAGTFNGWQPGMADFRFSDNGRLSFQVTPGKMISFKCTLGHWAGVETNAQGQDIPNRDILVMRDTLLNISIAGWKGSVLSYTRISTASSQVRVLENPFHMVMLNRWRTVRLYLPPDYATSRRRYRVLYMQDGQNCFDDSSAAYGEWRVDETLDSMFARTGQSVIVVAIDHGGNKRLQEYNPAFFSQAGEGEGNAYLDFLVNQLKPWVDKNYRTLPGREDTWLAGSSMGGVISMYGVAAHPGVFGGACIFSPAFWTSPSLYDTVAIRLGSLGGSRIYFYAGGMEGESMLPRTRQMFALVRQAPLAGIRLFENAKAGHRESAWAAQFPQFMHWWMQQLP